MIVRDECGAFDVDRVATIQLDYPVPLDDMAARRTARALAIAIDVELGIDSSDPDVATLITDPHGNQTAWVGPPPRRMCIQHRWGRFAGMSVYGESAMVTDVVEAYVDRYGKPPRRAPGGNLPRPEGSGADEGALEHTNGADP